MKSVFHFVRGLAIRCVSISASLNLDSAESSFLALILARNVMVASIVYSLTNFPPSWEEMILFCFFIDVLDFGDFENESLKTLVSVLDGGNAVSVLSRFLGEVVCVEEHKTIVLPIDWAEPLSVSTLMQH